MSDKIEKMVSTWQAERGLRKSELEIPQGAHSPGLTLMPSGVTGSILSKMEQIREARKSPDQKVRTL